MAQGDLWQRLADKFDIIDILNILDKDVEWLLRYKLREEILARIEEFILYDDYSCRH